MTTRTFLKLFVTLSALGLALPAAADPSKSTQSTDMTAARIVLASLHKDLTTPVLPKMSPRLYSAVGVMDAPLEESPLMQIAGRCGSSDYYCDSPGFLYCCGNSTDGFYCAADVNGCTR